MAKTNVAQDGQATAHPLLTASGPDAGKPRGAAGTFVSLRARRRYWVLLVTLIVLSIFFSLGLVFWDNPAEPGSAGFQLIFERRLGRILILLIVALCHSFATVAFHTVTNNRILTPSIMGFESLYRLIHTATIFFFGLAGVLTARTVTSFLIQLAIMVVMSMLLYGWLLTGHLNMHAMLLIGIVIGGGLGSMTTFMQRLLTPSEFDVLTARLFGSLSNADISQVPIAGPIAIAAAVLLYTLSRGLNVLNLGADPATNLGINPKILNISVLALVSVLMGVTTSLVGPMIFFGFLVATLSYQLAETYDHRYVLPMAFLTGYAVISGAYFLLHHVFYAHGVVNIVIELIGGGLFLLIILRKGRL